MFPVASVVGHVGDRPPPQSTPAQPTRGSSRPAAQSEQTQPPSSSSPFVEPQVTSSWADQMSSESSQATPKSKKKDGHETEVELSTAIATLSVEKNPEGAKEAEEEMDTSEVSKERPPLVHNVDPGEWAPATRTTTQPTQSGPEVAKQGDATTAKKKTQEERPPPVKTRRSPSHRSPSRSSTRKPADVPAARGRSRFRFPTRAVPSEAHGKVEPCAFCKGEGHYSSDCDIYPHVSSRARLAESLGLCCNCLKPHFGICIRKDPCSVCQQEGHHRAFCNENFFSVFDIDVPPEQFFDELRFRTYRKPPPGAETRPRYQSSYRERSRTEGQDQPGPSNRPPPSPERERSPEPSTSGAYRDMGFSPANSDESW
ncbi:zinc knuckle [Teladorsagia circumcincta]|uniref:Zinc knuckle n=1 Tax=Teladorsagia circumcincta TaxID=45464 RepID=A0A2G9UX48_TELCI|nr:zinc knuckle [Teladorsagia circumcincta]